MEAETSFVRGVVKFLLAMSYILPALIASFRKHPNHVAIAATNVLLGFTVLGWIVALIWSLTNTSKSSPRV